MTLTRHRILSLLLMLPLVPACYAAPSLDGVWSLVEKESDDPESALKGLGIVHRTQRYTTDAPSPEVQAQIDAAVTRAVTDIEVRQQAAYEMMNKQFKQMYINTAGLVRQ